MKIKRLGKVILVVIIMVNLLNLYNPFQEYKNHLRAIDRFVAYNISSQIAMLELVLDDLQEDLLVDQAYKTLDTEAIHTMIEDARNKIVLIDHSISNLELVNVDYDFELDSLIVYLEQLNKGLDKDVRPTEAEMMVIVTLKDIIHKYHNTTISQYYKDDVTDYNRMEVPEKTKLLFEELNTAVKGEA